MSADDKELRDSLQGEPLPDERQEARNGAVRIITSHTKESPYFTICHHGKDYNVAIEALQLAKLDARDENAMSKDPSNQNYYQLFAVKLGKLMGAPSDFDIRSLMFINDELEVAFHTLKKKYCETPNSQQLGSTS